LVALTVQQKTRDEEFILLQKRAQEWNSRHESAENRVEEVFAKSQQENAKLMAEVNAWKQKYNELAVEKATMESQIGVWQEKHRLELERRENLSQKVQELQKQVPKVTTTTEAQERVRVLEAQAAKDADSIMMLKSQVSRLKEGVRGDDEPGKDGEVDEEERSTFQKAQMFFAACGDAHTQSTVTSKTKKAKQ